jgi:hypothetical protein
VTLCSAGIPQDGGKAQTVQKAWARTKSKIIIFEIEIELVAPQTRAPKRINICPFVAKGSLRANANRR